LICVGGAVSGDRVVLGLQDDLETGDGHYHHPEVHPSELAHFLHVEDITCSSLVQVDGHNFVPGFVGLLDFDGFSVFVDLVSECRRDLKIFIQYVKSVFLNMVY